MTIPERFREISESAEGEVPTDDEVTGANASPGSMSTLLDNMRVDQTLAFSGERWTEASQIQQAIICLLEATTGPSPEGMSMEVVSTIRNVFQRLYRWHRNRGSDQRAGRFQTYVQNMTNLM